MSDNQEKILDHLGNEFETVLDLCTYYGVPIQIYEKRLKDGYSLEDALTAVVFDHLGNTYSSILAMCRHYKVRLSVFNKRRRAGLSLQDSLQSRVVYHDCNGNTFKTLLAMCNFYNIPCRVFKNRIRAGLSVQEALTVNADEKRWHRGKGTTDHFGNEFNSYLEMCDNYGIKYSTLHRRLAKGWSLQEALETPIKSYSVTDHREMFLVVSMKCAIVIMLK